MRFPRSLYAAFLLILLTAGQAKATLLTDFYSNDANTITSQGALIRIPELIPAYGVVEDYNETKRIPYPSHDGYAIVNQQGNFFDKVVNLQTDTGWLTMDFKVTNTTPFVWSDYHFEFWTPDFQTLLTNFPVDRFPGDAGHFPEGPYSNDIFLNSAFNGSILSFWSPASQAPGQTNDFLLTMNVDAIRAQYGASFGIRQVATTPEPGTLAILGIGLAAFFMIRNLRKPVSEGDSAKRARVS